MTFRPFAAGVEQQSPGLQTQPWDWEVEAAGIEPLDDFAATNDALCDCENCQQCRAALALHSEFTKWLEMASNDLQLQRLLASWSSIPQRIRDALLVMVEPTE